MEYVKLGRTGLDVSRICLGCMSYGDPAWRPWVLSEDAAGEHFRAAVEAGINFFDTADMYSRGRSEEVTGRWLRELTRRDEVVVASKLYFPLRDGPNAQGLSRKRVFDACDASLRRLGLDTIDLYQIHRWDPGTPIEETLEALDALVRAGKVRYLGASSMAAWQFAKAIYTADRLGLHRFVVDAEPLQPHLPRRRAGDDPALRRGGDRRDPVEPARAGASRRQPQAHGAGTHRAREERRLHAPALHRRRLRRRGRGGGGGARARHQAGAGRAGLDPPGAGGHRADRGRDAPGASPGGDGGGLDPARLGGGGAAGGALPAAPGAGVTTRPWPAGEPSRRRAARRPSTAVRRAAKRGPLRRGRRARAERRRDATPAPTGSARRRARRRSRRRRR